jgi:hypothetical protein
LLADGSCWQGRPPGQGRKSTGSSVRAHLQPGGRGLRQITKRAASLAPATAAGHRAGPPAVNLYYPASSAITAALTGQSWDELSRYALSVSESPVTSGDEIADHQVIIRGGQVEAVVVPLEEYRALKALEQREAELYWAVHEARYPSRPGDDAPDGKVYDSMDALLADLSSDG